MRGYWLPAALCLCAVLGCDDGPSCGPAGPVEPDLEAASIEIPKLHQGETITVTVTIKSSGLQGVPAPFSVTLLVSLDSDCSTDYCGPFEWRREEADGDLLWGEQLVLQAEVPVGAGEAVGTPLYFLVTADAGGRSRRASRRITSSPRRRLSCRPRGLTCGCSRASLSARCWRARPERSA